MHSRYGCATINNYKAFQLSEESQAAFADNLKGSEAVSDRQ